MNLKKTHNVDQNTPDETHQLKKLKCNQGFLNIYMKYTLYVKSLGPLLGWQLGPSWAVREGPVKFCPWVPLWPHLGPAWSRVGPLCCSELMDSKVNGLTVGY